MKKTRTMLALLVVLALLVSLTAATVSADETVTSTLDCTTLAPSTDAATVQETLKNAGVVEASNVVIEDMYNPMICTLGYQGEGYFVQKIEAGEGKVFAAAPVLTLNYRLASADPMGYIKVEGSIDGVTYYPFAELTEATGTHHAAENRGTVNVTLNGGEGFSTVWVKISMQHWTSQDGAAVDSSVITASVKAAPDDAPVVPENAVSSNCDFTTLTPTAGGAESNAVLESMGIIVPEGSNWQIVDHFSVCIIPKDGYQKTYYIQTLDAGEGKVLAEDATLDLSYALAAKDKNVDTGEIFDYDVGWIVVYASTDGENYEEVWVNEDGQGAMYENSAFADEQIALTGTAGASKVWVKVELERHAGETSGLIKTSTLSGMTKSASSDTPVDPADPSNPKDGDSISIFVALAAVCAAGAVITTKKFRKEN